jgi:hypothetical protein
VLQINDLPELIKNYGEILLFADDAKMFRHIKDQSDVDKLQHCCDILLEWSSKWMLGLNAKKCVVMNVKRKTENRYYSANLCLTRVVSSNTNAGCGRN